MSEAFNRMDPLPTNATPNRAVRVGYTQSNLTEYNIDNLFYLNYLRNDNHQHCNQVYFLYLHTCPLQVPRTPRDRGGNPPPSHTAAC